MYSTQLKGRDYVASTRPRGQRRPGLGITQPSLHHLAQYCTRSYLKQGFPGILLSSTLRFVALSRCYATGHLHCTHSISSVDTRCTLENENIGKKEKEGLSKSGRTDDATGRVAEMKKGRRGERDCAGGREGGRGEEHRT